MYYVFIVNITEEVEPLTHPGTQFQKKNPRFGVKAAAATHLAPKRSSAKRIQAFKQMALTPSNEPLFDEDFDGQTKTEICPSSLSLSFCLPFVPGHFETHRLGLASGCFHDRSAVPSEVQGVAPPSDQGPHGPGGQPPARPQSGEDGGWSNVVHGSKAIGS